MLLINAKMLKKLNSINGNDVASIGKLGLFCDCCCCGCCFGCIVSVLGVDDTVVVGDVVFESVNCSEFLFDCKSMANRSRYSSNSSTLSVVDVDGTDEFD